MTWFGAEVSSTDKKRESSKLSFLICVLADAALLCTTHRCNVSQYKISGGFYTGWMLFFGEPFIEFNWQDRSVFSSVLRQALLSGNPNRVGPLVERGQRTALEIRTKSRSWSEFEKKSIGISLEVYEQHCQLTVYAKHCRGGSWLDYDQFERKVAIEKSEEEIADILIEHLSNRLDLPFQKKSAKLSELEKLSG